VCGFTNALLLVFTFVCTVVDDAAALLQAREREGGEEPAAAAAAAAAAATSLPLLISILVMQGVCAGVVSKLHHSDAAVTSVRVRARTPKSMGIDDSRSERARRLVRASGAPYGVPISASLVSKMLHVLQSPAKLLRIPDAARNHNLQVVYVHLIGETLGSALLLLSYLADRGEGGAVDAGTQFTRFTRALAQILTPGWASAQTHNLLYIYIYIYIYYIHIHIYIYTYVHTYIHTYIHTYT
jgi:Co/Zn/Cd efflux system component